MTQENSEDVLHAKSSKKYWIISGMFVAVCVTCAMPDFVIFLVELLLGFLKFGALLIFGWIFFLRRVGSEIRFDMIGVMIGIGAFVCLLFGVKYAARHIFHNSSLTTSRTIQIFSGATVILLAGISLVGLGHELSWQIRSPTPWAYFRNSFDDSSLPRRESRERLKRIGLAFYEFHEISASFPGGGTFKSDGSAEHGWITRLLPFLNQADLYNRIHLDVPWYHPSNRDIFETRLEEFDDPRRTVARVRPDGYGPAFYSANDKILSANVGLTFSQITDGYSNTIMAGEVKEKIRPWGHVANWRNLDLGINKSPDGFGGFAVDGISFLLVDGSVRFVSEKIDPTVLHALSTPASGDTVGAY